MLDGCCLLVLLLLVLMIIGCITMVCGIVWLLTMNGTGVVNVDVDVVGAVVGVGVLLL